MLNFLSPTNQVQINQSFLSATAISIFMSLAMITTSVKAEEPDPCGAELCLSGMAALSGNVKPCKVHVKKFFSIRGIKKGIFIPGASYAKRYKWLKQCDSGNKAFQATIMANYGHLYDLPL